MEEFTYNIERCLEPKHLEKLLYEDLEDDVFEKLSSHVAQCKDCRERFKSLLIEEARVVNLVRVYAERDIEKREECVQDKAFYGYAMNVLGEEKSALVKKHLKTCTMCRLKLFDIVVRLSQPIELEFEISELEEEKTKSDYDHDK